MKVKEFFDGVNNGTIRAVSNEERIWRFLEESRKFRAENPALRGTWKTVNVVCEKFDELHEPTLFMDNTTGRFSVLPGMFSVVGLVPVGQGWAP